MSYPGEDSYTWADNREWKVVLQLLSKDYHNQDLNIQTHGYSNGVDHHYEGNQTETYWANTANVVPSLLQEILSPISAAERKWTGQ